MAVAAVVALELETEAGVVAAALELEAPTAGVLVKAMSTPLLAVASAELDFR